MAGVDREVTEIDFVRARAGQVRVSLWQCGACLSWTPKREDRCRKCAKSRPAGIAPTGDGRG